ncbi:MAG: hypothetical protein ACRCZY_03645, partial [Phocaeicola sp.]
TTTQDWIVGSANEKKETYIPVDIDFSINKAYNFSVNFGTGNGGYDDDGDPIIDQKEMIQFDTNFSDWDDETIIPVPQPEPAKMKFTIKTLADGEEFVFPFGTIDGPAFTESYTLHINWGDGSAVTEISPNTEITTETAHTYTKEGTYQITITSSEKDYDKVQVPLLSSMSKGGREGNVLTGRIISIDTPLLHIGGEMDGDRMDNMLPPAFAGHPITTIPKDLLKHNKQITMISAAFQGCTELKSIPKELFDYTPGITDLGMVFAGAGITEIDPDLFKNCTQLKNAPGLFMLCTSLEKIPAGLFSKNSLLENMESIFGGCVNAIVEKNLFCDEDSEKTTRFAGIAPNFTGAFNGVGSELAEVENSFLPELWLYTYKDGIGEPAQYGKDSCFTNANASNSDNVDAGWE